MAEEYDDAKATECHCGLLHSSPGSLGQFVCNWDCIIAKLFAHSDIRCNVFGRWDYSTVKLGINYDFNVWDSISFGETFCRPACLILNYF